MLSVPLLLELLIGSAFSLLGPMVTGKPFNPPSTFYFLSGKNIVGTKPIFEFPTGLFSGLLLRG